MKRAFHLSSIALLASTASADINGFGGLSPSDWTLNVADSGLPVSVLSDDLIQFTAGPDNQRSLWNNTRQNITAFEASFTYRASRIAASGARQGITFTVQNAGLDALGTQLGYEGIAPSLAVTLQNDTGPGLTFSGVTVNGDIGGSAPVTPVNAFDFQEIDVTIRYEDARVTVSMTDGTNTFDSPSFLVGDLPSILGSQNAFVGFTASTANTLGAGGGSDQFLSDFRFTTIPAPGVPAVLAVAGAMACRRRR